MSVTAPLGFRAAGVAAGLKESGQPDVAVVLNDGPSRAAAAVFTRNRVQAAPVTWTRQVVSGGRVRAVVLNSGGANACTGAAWTRLEVNTAAAARDGPSFRTTATSGWPDSFSPAATPAARNPSGAVTLMGTLRVRSGRRFPAGRA